MSAILSRVLQGDTSVTHDELDEALSSVRRDLLDSVCRAEVTRGLFLVTQIELMRMVKEGSTEIGAFELDRVGISNPSIASAFRLHNEICRQYASETYRELYSE